MNGCTDGYEGTCVLDKQAPRPYSHTDMARYFPENPSSPPPSPSPSAYFTAASMTLLNGDVCRIGDWILYSLSAGDTEAPAYLGRIWEIIVATNRTQQYPKPDAILLQQAIIAECVEPYKMPMIRITDNWVAAEVQVSGLLSEPEVRTF